MIDTHAHLNFQAFKDDYAQVIEQNFKNGLKAVINVGSNLQTSQKAIEIAKEFKNCYAAIGLHPIHVKDEKLDKGKYILLIKENKDLIKAVGETGLDFFRNQELKFKNEKLKSLQKEVFLKHLELAQEFNLPVILHCRGSKENPKDAYIELLKIIKDLKQVPRGVIHCFSADWGMAQEYLNLDFFIGFTGPITFKNATPELLQVVERSPLNKILLETDCPFLAPEPYRGQRNEPVYIRFMAQKIAEIKNISFEKVVETTTKNAKKLFRL
ncbi:TatD family hydrolase [Patescibacteria group bacterium]|nr:TatD family hydrolase [Patescibacteria group bacterium]